MGDAGDRWYRRLEQLFLQSPQAVVVTLGPDHFIDFANPAFFQALGTRDCCGKRVRDAFPEVESQGYLELLDHVFTTGRSYSATEAPLWIDRDGGGELEEAFFNFRRPAPPMPMWVATGTTPLPSRVAS